MYKKLWEKIRDVQSLQGSALAPASSAKDLQLPISAEVRNQDTHSGTRTRVVGCEELMWDDGLSPRILRLSPNLRYLEQISGRLGLLRNPFDL